MKLRFSMHVAEPEQVVEIDPAELVEFETAGGGEGELWNAVEVRLFEVARFGVSIPVDEQMRLLDEIRDLQRD